MQYMDFSIHQIVKAKESVGGYYFPLFIAINKIDLIQDETILREKVELFKYEIKKVMKDWAGAQFFIYETSAKTGHNINTMFVDAARKCIYKYHIHKQIIEQVLIKDSLILNKENSTTVKQQIHNKKKCHLM